MSKYNCKVLNNNIILIPVKDNFLDCEFNVKEILTNIPDKWATSYKSTLNNGFRIIADMSKTYGGFTSKVEIEILTNKLHNVQDDIKEIIEDIKTQDIYVEKLKKRYKVEGNNYKIEI